MEINTKYFGAQLAKLHRNFNLSFPLDSVGFIEDHPIESLTTQGTLELCIRLSSSSEHAIDRIGNTTYHCKFPNVCCKVPEFAHTITVDKPRDAVYFKYPPELADSMRKAGFIREPYCWEFSMTPTISNILSEVRELLKYTFEYGMADRLDLLGIRLWEELLLGRDNEDHRSEQIDTRIRRIASYLHINFLQEIDFDDLIRKHGLSRRSFFRLWNAAFPYTPAAYVRDLKLKEAKRLVKNTTIPIWEISNRLSFHNSSYFCRLFKQRYGITPLAYRQGR